MKEKMETLFMSGIYRDKEKTDEESSECCEWREAAESEASRLLELVKELSPLLKKTIEETLRAYGRALGRVADCKEKDGFIDGFSYGVKLMNEVYDEQ